MSPALGLLLGAVAAGVALLLALLLLRQGDGDARPAGRGAALGRELAANACGFLFIAALGASSGLLAATLSRLLQSQG